MLRKDAAARKENSFLDWIVNNLNMKCKTYNTEAFGQGDGLEDGSGLNEIEVELWPCESVSHCEVSSRATLLQNGQE